MVMMLIKAESDSYLVGVVVDSLLPPDTRRKGGIACKGDETRVHTAPGQCPAVAIHAHLTAQVLRCKSEHENQILSIFCGAKSRYR